MKLRLTLSIGFWLALGLLAFAAVDVRYANFIFTSGMRWVLLLALVLILAVRGRLFLGLKGGVGRIAAGFLLLIALSSIWSWVPGLSWPKSLAYVAVALAFSAGGAYYAGRVDRSQVLRVFWPLIAIALLAGVGGTVQEGGSLQMNEVVTIYRGLTSNPNFLGILVLCGLPALLWEVHLPRRSKWGRAVVLLLLAGCLAILLHTYSRASILSCGVLGLFYFYGSGLRRYGALLALAVLGVVLFPIILPDAAHEIEVRYLYKGDRGADSLFNSRTEVWEASIQGAEAGGVFGLGFGVSAGYTEFDGGFNSVGYGREKGNVSLAILEEIGVAGFLLYLWLSMALFARLAKSAVRARSPDDRLLLILILGSLVSLTLNSQFEAWYIAPGAAATPVYWALIGIGLSLSKSVLRESRSTASAPLPGAAMARG